MKAVLQILKLKKKKKKVEQQQQISDTSYKSPIRSAAPHFDVNSFKLRVKKNMERLKSAKKLSPNKDAINSSPSSPKTPSPPAKPSSFVTSPVLDSPANQSSNTSQAASPSAKVVSNPEFSELSKTVKSFYQELPLSPAPVPALQANAPAPTLHSTTIDDEVQKLEGLCDALYKYALELRVKMIKENRSVDENYEKYLRAASKHGNYYASVDLAEYLLWKQHSDQEEISKLLEHAAQHGHQKAQILTLYY